MPFRPIQSLFTAFFLAATCCAQDGVYSSAFSSSRYPTLTPATTSLFSQSYSGHQGTEQFLNSHAACLTPVECAPVACGECCSSPCDECGRHIAFDVSSVLMFRQRPRSQQLLVSPINAAEAIDAADFDFGVAPGVEVGLITYEFFKGIDLELRAMWLDDWSDQASQAFTGSTVQISANPPLGTSGPRIGLAIYDSKFLSTEVNLRGGYSGASDTTFVLGVRAKHPPTNNRTYQFQLSV